MPLDAALSKIMDENRFRLLESRMRDSSSATPTTASTVQSDEEEDEVETSESNVMLVDTPPVFTSSPSSQASPKKRRQKRNFTTEEDELILAGYEKHPEDWDKIIAYSQLDRNAKQIKSRFTRILKGRARPVGNSPPRKQQRTSLSSGLRTSQGPSSDSALSSSPTSPRAATPSLLTESATSVPAASTRDDDSDWQRKYQQKEKELLQMKEEYEKRIQKLEDTVKQTNAQLDLARVRQDTPKEDGARAADSGTGPSFDRSLDQRTKAMILRFVVENAETAYKLRQLQVWENSARLGKLRIKPHAHRYYEAWEDGSAFQELELRQHQLKERRDKIDAKKKDVSRIKASLKSHRNADSPSTAPDAEITENEKLLQRVLLTEEVLRQQLASLKREETELTSQHQELTFERSLHRKQWKLLYDQEQSVFNSHPLLNQRYALQNLLGRGGFSEVYGAFDLLQQRVVACKIHQLNVNWSQSKKENYRKHALREYQIQKGVSHPRVVRLFDVFVLDESSFCTILEYCDDGDLDSRLKERNKLSEKETRCIVAQIVEGLTYLNRLDHPIIHYDLKPGNILFHQGEVKITDFGLSKIVENSPDGMVDLTSQGAGTRGYLPPECSEMCDSIAKISSKVDVWSLGIICYQMLFGQIPEGSLEGDDLKFPSKISEDCRHFIEQCLTRNQTSRPDVFTIAKSPFLTLKSK